jgi:hypothetical protein
LRFPQPGHTIPPILGIEPTVSLVACDISGGSDFRQSNTWVRRPENRRGGGKDQEGYL